jgi:hypothetical protein
MALGQQFPVSDYYKEHILDAETIARGGGWWTAVLLIADPKTNKPFVTIYRWQSDGETWKTRKSISLKNKKQVDQVIQIFGRLREKMHDS